MFKGKSKSDGKVETESSASGTARWVARHEWTIVGGLAILAFLMGCIGYFQVMVFTDSGGEHTWWDPVYASLQLFIFEGPDATGQWPLHLQIARALAPMVLLYTAAVAIFKQLDTEIALYKLHFYRRRFVVVCGIGEVGYRIARDYCLNSDKIVVTIDREADNPLAAELAHYGAINLVGNALDPLTLLKSRVMYAKEVFLCTSDDQANISAAKTIERLCRRIGKHELARLAVIASRGEAEIAGEPASVGLRAFLCVDEPDLYEMFSNHTFFSSNSTRFSVRLFNRSETFARNIFRLCAPDMYYLPADRSVPPMNILIVGFGPLVRELILQTALTAHYPDFRSARVTVLCKEGRRTEVARFFHSYPHLDKILEIAVVYDDAMTVTGQRWQELQDSGNFSVAYVAADNDVEGTLTARRLVRLNRLQNMPLLYFVVCLNQQTFLAEIIDDDFQPISEDKSALPPHAPIEYFEALDETVSIDIIVNDALDGMARALHNSYMKTLFDMGETLETNASLLPWSELPAHKKKANQHAAAHMQVKLRCSGCESVPLEDPRDEVPFPVGIENMDVLAQLEHRRWMAEKYLAGYSYGTVRDEDHMLHPDLIPWEDLGESDREKDRNNIRQIPELMQRQGHKICLSAQHPGPKPEL
jgi:hypothetical protein